MTLEQIRNRQANINSSLESHVNESNSVMHTIAGTSQVPSGEQKETTIPNGLLQEIDAMQSYTEELLNALYSNQKRLVAHTYAPNEPMKE